MLNKIRDKIRVDFKLRENIFSRKNVEEITQTKTLRLREPSEEELRDEFTYVEKIVGIGDKMYKFSFDVYGTTEYWWVIAWFNNKPTDMHCKIGDVLYIPLPLSRALAIATREE
tara:strand:- start:100 stop:441 length:342 start_codon:yes stop_codon:yes gene_type:complete